MTRADTGRRRPAVGKRAVKPVAAGVAAPTTPSARADRIARIATDLAELANDGLIGDDDQDVDLPAVWGRAPRGPRRSSRSPRI